MDEEHIKKWFTSVVLPMEPQLLSYLSRRWKDRTEIHDMLHDVYERALTGARGGIPQNGRAYVFAILRNLMISRAVRDKIVSFDLVADIETMPADHEELTPERHATGREELRRVIEALDSLPPRCREMMRLRKVEGLTTREVADRLGVSPAAVERQITRGMRTLADFLLSGSGRIERKRQIGARRLLGRSP